MRVRQIIEVNVWGNNNNNNNISNNNNNLNNNNNNKWWDDDLKVEKDWGQTFGAAGNKLFVSQMCFFEFHEFTMTRNDQPCTRS